MNSRDLESQEAFIASSFIEFHTQESPSGEWIPVSESEAREVFEDWLAEHDAALIEGLVDEAAVEVEPDAPDDFLRGFDAGVDAVYAFLREKARQRREGQGREG